MELKDLFDEAVINSKTLPEKPSNELLLQLYSLYKQSTQGDVAVDESTNLFDFVAQAKLNAWRQLQGKSTVIAMQQYIDIVNKLKGYKLLE